jgi:hypothetical protein
LSTQPGFVASGDPDRRSHVRCRNSLFFNDRGAVYKSLYPNPSRLSLIFCRLCGTKSQETRFLPHGSLAWGICRGVGSIPIVGAFSTVRIADTQPLFAWTALEDSPSMGTIRRCLEAIPDSALLQGLRVARGRGRDDYPVSLLWGVAVLTPLLRHHSYDACLAEVRRNPALRRLLGVQTDDQIPRHWNLSRFLDVLGHPAHLAAMRAGFDAMVARLAPLVPDLGHRTAGDATALSARRGSEARQKAETRLGLPQPTGGRKEYKDAEGNVERVVEWFGYKLHLLVDVRHELALAYRITAPAIGDNEMIGALLAQARGNLPAGRIESLAYDKAADDEKVHQVLHAAGIKPLIENRALWESEPERVLPGHTGRSNLVYDESGTIHCYDKVSTPPIRHPMAYIGHERTRGTLKYRCPARHEGWPCPSESRCNEGRAYGLVARIKSELDLRRFPPIPRMTKQFERLYKGRTAVERVNARVKLYWGADDGNVIGARRFHAMVGIVMLVHLALGTTLARSERGTMKTLGGTRLNPIGQALDEQIDRERTRSGEG